MLQGFVPPAAEVLRLHFLPDSLIGLDLLRLQLHEAQDVVARRRLQGGRDVADIHSQGRTGQRRAEMTPQDVYWQGSIGDRDAVFVAIPFTGFLKTQATGESGGRLLRPGQRFGKVAIATTIYYICCTWTRDGTVKTAV